LINIKILVIRVEQREGGSISRERLRKTAG